MTSEDKLEKLLSTTIKKVMELNPDPMTIIDFLGILGEAMGHHIAFKNFFKDAVKLMNYSDWTLDDGKLLETYQKALEDKQRKPI